MEAYLPLFQIFGFSLLAGIVISYLKSFKEKPKKWAIEIIANFLGALLVFSGFVKALDPLGTSYKMQDYFNAFTQFTGVSFAWLANMSTFLAVFMIVLEIILGIALVLGFKRKITIGLTAAMMLFFTVLTGFTYLTGFINPDYYDLGTRTEMKAAGENVKVFVEYNKLQMKVTDCGCFGDFLKLEPKVSFYKDIFLMGVLAVLAFFSKNITQLFGNRFSWIKIAGSAVFFTLFSMMNYVWGLPMVDFRPYKIGKDINEQRIEIPDKLDYGFVFKNVKTGKTKRVTMADYGTVNADPEWEFTNEQDNIVLEKGVEATISNFGAYDADGYDKTDDILLNEDYSFWVLSRNLKKSDLKAWNKLNGVYEYAEENNKDMFAFMAVNFGDAELFRHDVQAPYPFYQADETFIKTVVRANPGLVLLKNGIVMGKWHHSDIPNKEQMAKYIESLK